MIWGVPHTTRKRWTSCITYCRVQGMYWSGGSARGVEEQPQIVCSFAFPCTSVARTGTCVNELAGTALHGCALEPVGHAIVQWFRDRHRLTTPWMCRMLFARRIKSGVDSLGW